MKTIYLSRKAIKAVQVFADPKNISILNGVCVEATATQTRVLASHSHGLAAFTIETKNGGIVALVRFVLPLSLLAKLKNSTPARDSLVIGISEENVYTLYDWGTRIRFTPSKGDYTRACKWFQFQD